MLKKERGRSLVGSLFISQEELQDYCLCLLQRRSKHKYTPKDIEALALALDYFIVEMLIKQLTPQQDEEIDKLSFVGDEAVSKYLQSIGFDDAFVQNCKLEFEKQYLAPSNS